MKKLLQLFSLAICMLSSFQGESQTAVSLPPTPESQSLLKTVNIQVNKATGVVGFAIPLYNAGTGSVGIPIVLSHTCAAIKVQDIASWVGTGWNLSSGGKITRVIVGEDDLQGGYSDGQGKLANNWTSWWNTGNVKPERKASHTGNPCSKCNRFDGEPDLYYYEIPGRTGMFVIDQDRKAWTIPYSNLKIELKNDNTFLFTDESGTRYYFNLKESTRQISHSDRAHTNTSGSPYGEKSEIRDYIATWHLTMIESLSREQINLVYSRGDEISYENNNYIQLGNDPVVDKSVYYKTTPYYLDEISWNSGKLQFISSAGRTDVVGCRRLNEIKIYTLDNKYYKSIKFTYSQFASKRLRLDKIEEISGNQSVTLGKYEYYTENNLPGRNSKDIDHWGYYNGRGNKGWFPDGENDNYGNRAPAFQYTMANMMKRSYNSMGGYTEYEYEPNTITGGTIVGGVRIKSIKTSDNNGNIQTLGYAYSGGTSFNTYTVYSNSISGKKLLYSYSTINLHDTGGSNVYYGEVTETLANGSKIISSYTTYGDSESNDIPSMDYISVNSGSENPSISLFPNSSRFWRRGLVKKEIHKDASGKEVKRINNVYQFPLIPKARVKGYHLESFQTSLNYTIDHVVVYDWLSEPIYLTSETVTGEHALNMTHTMVYDTVYCAPVEEKVTFENGDVYQTITKYAFSYKKRESSTGYIENNAIDLLLSSGLDLLPIEQVQYKNGSVIGGELSVYKSYQTGLSVTLPVLDKKKSLKSLPIVLSGFTLSTLNSSGQFIHDTRYETIQSYDCYDSKGRLLSWHDENGIQRSAIYTECLSDPIAITENAKYAIPELVGVRDSSRRNFTGDMLFPLSVPMDQTVSFWLRNYQSYPVVNRVALRIRFYNSNGLCVNQGSLAFGLPLPIRVELPAGEYAMRFTGIDILGRDTLQRIGGDYDLVINHVSRDNDVRNNQVFYTSFEYDSDAIIPLGKAKTGAKACKKSFEISLKNMLPGNYVLSYWKSTNDGQSWEYVKTDLEITSSSLKQVIGSTSYLIDEVRLIPQDATLISCSYMPGIGKTSETDINGLTVYYEYDVFGRLIRVLDNERRTVKEYEYFVNFK